MSYKLEMLMPTEPIRFINVIKHTKDNLDFVIKSKDNYENLDALIVNIKNSLTVIDKDVENINKDVLTSYVRNLKRSRELLMFIINKGINNVISIVASLPKDNYDSMSKEELIALLRKQNSK